MRYLLLIAAISTSLFACDSGSTGRPDSDGVVYVKQNTRGFEAIVNGSYTAREMQDKFSNYCKRQGKIMRSLRMIPDENGKKRVIGDCL